ncbi:hypothetical protein DFH08DRAFT_945690 [Mycena albidolilacea]|uniref:Protein CPL1-like domain-containing protein n=1 Tax=Mycena albidolilacea TaxID=1033008 RepID=A0AAD6YZQ9_9AGAR|nr:hypothetical protein DFH08DRAFT_945690 [Mycena albidolilacea]
MQFTWAYTAIIASALLAPFVAATGTLSVDVCGEVDAELKLPSLLPPFKPKSFGIIKECLCISTIPEYIESNLLLGAIALFGKKALIAELTLMVNNCAGSSQCHYPSHSVPSCKSGSPCYFTCTDGYSAYPSGAYPTQCVCSYPYTECNGKCGTFRGCPSTYYAKREIVGKCSEGYTACGVPGAGAKSWDCIDTQTDLESCGGCPYSDLSYPSPLGKDCTLISGVSDVACVKGHCVVHKCISGYDLKGTSGCIYSEDNVVLAAQYGLEHNQL